LPFSRIASGFTSRVRVSYSANTQQAYECGDGTRHNIAKRRGFARHYR